MRGLVGVGILICWGCDPVGTRPPDAAVVPQVEAYDWVLVFDTGEGEGVAETPGVDVCGVEVRCDDEVLVPAAARLAPGAGALCTGAAEGCAVDRSNPGAARDDGTRCALDSDPSDFVSTGVGGLLSLRFDRDLRGCDIEVREQPDDGPEPYAVYLCDRDFADSGCLGDGPLGASEAGGVAIFMVPAAPE